MDKYWQTFGDLHELEILGSRIQTCPKWNASSCSYASLTNLAATRAAFGRGLAPYQVEDGIPPKKFCMQQPSF
jgi:hypothetical protein